MIVDLDAPVLANTRLTADYNVVALSAPEIARHAAPGQFVMIKVGHDRDPLLRRPFSVFEIVKDTEGQPVGISLLSKRVGMSTSRLFDVAVGQRIRCLGPLGRPFTPVAPPAAAWMVAGGVGLAPFATLTDALRARGVATTLFYGARSGHELLYLDDFEQRGVDLVLTTEDGSRGERGRVTAPLERHLAGLPADAALMIYACGPEPMLSAVARLAGAYGRPSQVSVERVMGCGLGGCYSCVIPTRNDQGAVHYVRSCLSGPVFRGEDIVWAPQ